MTALPLGSALVVRQINADPVAVGKFLEVQGAAISHLMLGEFLLHMTFVDICVCLPQSCVLACIAPSNTLASSATVQLQHTGSMKKHKWSKMVCVYVRGPVCCCNLYNDRMPMCLYGVPRFYAVRRFEARYPTSFERRYYTSGKSSRPRLMWDSDTASGGAYFARAAGKPQCSDMSAASTEYAVRKRVSSLSALSLYLFSFPSPDLHLCVCMYERVVVCVRAETRACVYHFRVCLWSNYT